MYCPGLEERMERRREYNWKKGGRGPRKKADRTGLPTGEGTVAGFLLLIISRNCIELIMSRKQRLRRREVSEHAEAEYK